MAEYIEREALLNALKEERKNGNFVFTSKWIKEIMDNLPTADVIPKSEVEHILSDLKKEIRDKAVYPEVRSVNPYITLKVVDAIINNKMEEIRNEKEK